MIGLRLQLNGRNMDNISALIARITRLEDEVKVLRKERDRFKSIASNAENETARRRVEYLALESEYEDERRKRRNAVCNILDTFFPLILWTSYIRCLKETLLDTKNYALASVSKSETKLLEASSSSVPMVEPYLLSLVNSRD
jgi:hypothetical protein